MGLASDMKNLTEDLLASFKQRIKDNEELVNDVQRTLDGFRKDQMDMAASLRKGLARGEKERLTAFNGLMSGIHGSISSIQKEVAGIQTSTFDMIKEFAADREQMSADLTKSFTQERAERMKNEHTRMKEFDTLMKNISDDIRNINDDVAAVFKETNDMLDRFELEHQDMSAELRAELGKNLSERVEYTRTMLKGFQKRLSDIGKENQKMAQKLRKDLASGETERLSDYNGIMKGIHAAIKGIRKEVKDIEKSTAGMVADLLQNRVEASAEWIKMQNAMAQIRKTGVAKPPKNTVSKIEKKEEKKSIPVEAVKQVQAIEEQTFTALEDEPKTLEEKVLAYIKKHPNGVKVSEMEGPLKETRMKIGFTAKGLLDEGKVQKIENIYYPVK
jgi:predicted HicB family RNase H-like nuclease